MAALVAGPVQAAYPGEAHERRAAVLCARLVHGGLIHSTLKKPNNRTTPRSLALPGEPLVGKPKFR